MRMLVSVFSAVRAEAVKFAAKNIKFVAASTVSFAALAMKRLIKR